MRIALCHFHHHDGCYLRSRCSLRRRRGPGQGAPLHRGSLHRARGGCRDPDRTFPLSREAIEPNPFRAALWGGDGGRKSCIPHCRGALDPSGITASAPMGWRRLNAEPNDARLHGVCSAGPQRPRKRGGTPAIVSPLIMATRVCTVHPHTPPSRPRRGGFGYASQLSVDVGPSGWMSLRWVNTPSALYFRRHPTPIPRLRPTRRPWAPLQSNRHRGVCGADAGHASGRMIPILTNWIIAMRPTTADGSRGSGGTPQGGLRAHSFDLVRACAKARHALCRTSIRIRSSSTARPSRGDRHQRNAFCCIRLRVTTRSW